MSEVSRDLLEHEMIARYLRGRIIASLLSRGVRSLGRLLRWGLTVVTGLIRRSMTVIVRTRARRATIRVLTALDNRILQDIGVSRGDIYAIAEDLAVRCEAFPAGHTPGELKPAA